MTEQEKMFQEILMKRRMDKSKARKEKKKNEVYEKYPKELLWDMYVDKEMSMMKIESEIGITHRILEKLMYEYGIDKRINKKIDIKCKNTIDDFIKYLHTIFTTNANIEKLSDVVYYIDNKYSFEWHTDSIKSNKRIIELNTNECCMVIPFEEWSGIEFQSKYIAKCTLDNEIIRLFKSYTDINVNDDAAGGDVFKAIKRKGSILGYKWKFVDINGVDVDG